MSFGTRKHALVRQRREIKHSQRPEREEPDVIISELGSATLRHIKSRRAKGSEVKVAVTVADEEQLREIFDAFDFDKSGNVSLLEFDKALAYIRESRHFRKLHKELDNLHQTFIEMDVDGDATVDYQEFTIGMTGTANGALDGFSPTDLNKLLAKFVEFALITKRQRNIDAISESDYHGSDMERYEYFNRIFELHAQSGLEHTGASVVSDDSMGKNRAMTPAQVRSRKTQNLANSLLEDMDEEEESLKHRLLEEKAAIAESQNLRFEVLKLPKIRRSVPEIKTVLPSMTIMPTSTELKLKYKASREAFTAVHGNVDWTSPKYRMSAPKHVVHKMRASQSDGKLLKVSSRRKTAV